MPSLYDILLPHVQAINSEGGNFSSFHLSHPVLDAIDAGAASDPSLKMIREKVLETIDGYKGKRDHLRFNKIFEAYSEGVVYLAAARRRQVALQAVPDGASHGKTSDFVTASQPAIGLEVKTINVVDPARTIDKAMDRGFETAYASLEAARAKSRATGRPAVGTAVGEFAPHGEGANPDEAVSQTAAKIKANLKRGQYEARPTLLVVNLVRLGVFQHWSNLRQRLEVDADWDEAPSGHLFAIAAQRLADPFFTHSYKWPDIRDAGPLREQGVLRDHDYIPAIVFMQTIRHRGGDSDALETAFRFYGVWNAEWSGEGFSGAQKAEARRVFDQLCDGWNDTLDSQGGRIPDVAALHNAFLGAVTEIRAMRGESPDPVTLHRLMVDADRAFFLWKAADAGHLDAAAAYLEPADDEIVTGVAVADGRPTVFVSAPAIFDDLPRLRLVKQGQKWEAADEAWPVTACAITF